MRLHETLNVLFDYLKDTGRTMHLKASTYYLENVSVKDYAYMEEIPNTLSFSLGHVFDELSKESGRFLEFATTQGHNIWVDLEDVNAILFDAIASSPKSAEEMRRCIEKLENKEPYNVYLVHKDSKGEKWIFDMFRVSKGSSYPEIILVK